MGALVGVAMVVVLGDPLARELGVGARETRFFFATARGVDPPAGLPVRHGLRGLAGVLKTFAVPHVRGNGIRRDTSDARPSGARSNVGDTRGFLRTE